MILTDIAPVAAWASLEKSIHDRFSVNAAVFDANGIRVTDFMNWANPLCPAIKSSDRGKTYICASAHENLAAGALRCKGPVAEHCDAGMMKVVVPIFKNGDFIGAAGGCGVLLPGGDVDAYYIEKVTEMATDETASLIQDVKTVSRDTLDELSGFIEAYVRVILNGH